MNKPANLTVQHQPEQNRFSLTTGDSEAVLQYRLFERNTQPMIDFTHTWVPPEFRGKGVAEKLVREGLAWARAEGFGIQASCWYVARFLKPSDHNK